LEGRAPRDSHLALKNLARRAGLKYNPDHCTVTQSPLVREIAWMCLLAALGGTPAAWPQAPAASQTEQDTPEVHLGKGYDALRQDRYEEAASEFRAALALDPKLVMRARFPLAVALFELKQSAEARREFESVRREVGEHPNVAYYLGRLDLMDQNFEGAIRYFNQAITKPPFPDTAYYLGLAYFKSGDLKAAEKWLKQAAEINPRDSLAPYQLGLVFRKEGRDEEARKAVALSAELRRQDADDSQLRS
jgi:tetratricopeptide (TPR) repeat protein